MEEVLLQYEVSVETRKAEVQYNGRGKCDLFKSLELIILVSIYFV